MEGVDAMDIMKIICVMENANYGFMSKSNGKEEDCGFNIYQFV